VQDDATVCRHFAEAVNAAVRSRPDRVLAFFVAGAPHRTAANVVAAGERGDSWAEWVPSEWFPCVCSCWPRHIVAELLAYVDGKEWRHSHLGDDHRTGSFLRDSHRGALCSVPSLAQHADTVASLIGAPALGGLNPARVSCCYIGNYDPRTLEW
jgi:hypothetical protein